MQTCRSCTTDSDAATVPLEDTPASVQVSTPAPARSEVHPRFGHLRPRRPRTFITTSVIDLTNYEDEDGEEPLPQSGKKRTAKELDDLMMGSYYAHCYAEGAKNLKRK